MKIRMITGIAGVGFSLSPGDETERFSANEAIRMIEAQQASPVRDEPEPERAVRRRGK